MPDKLTLKGLTSNDRAVWEEKYHDMLLGRSKDEIDNAYINAKFKQKYSNSTNWDNLKNLDIKQKIDYWNNQFDNQLKTNLKRLKNVDPKQIIGEKDIKPTAQETTRTQQSEFARDIKKIEDFKQSEQFQNILKAEDNERELKELYLSDNSTNYQNLRQNVETLRRNIDEISPWARKYGHTGWLNMSEKEWEELAIRYEAYAKVGEIEKANYIVDNAIQKNITKNMPANVKASKMFQAFGASLTQGVLSTVALIDMPRKIITEQVGRILRGEKIIPNGGTYFDALYKDAVMDNILLQFGEDVAATGHFWNLDKHLKELERTGISDTTIPMASDSEAGSFIGDITDPNFYWNQGGNVGFLLSSIVGSKGLGFLTKEASIAAKAAIISNMTKAGQSLTKVKNALASIQRAENFAHKGVIPMMMGTSEGIIEASSTSRQTLEDGLKAIEDRKQEEIQKEFKKLAKSYYDSGEIIKRINQKLQQKNSNGKNEIVKIIDPELQYRLAEQEVLEEIKEEAFKNIENLNIEQTLKDQAYLNAIRAGSTNLVGNSLINGVLNYTLKNTIFAPETAERMRSIKIFGKTPFKPKNEFNVTGSGTNVRVTANKPSTLKTIFGYIKEPIGEMSEEGLQSLSDAFAQGAAVNNLTRFMDAQYSGDGSMILGDILASDLVAAFKATGDAFTDKETWEAAYSGFLMSAVGHPFIIHRATKMDASGNVVTGKDGKPVKTWGRGLNAEGKKESKFEMLSRLTPWRSGIMQHHKEEKARKSELKTEEELLTQWLSDSENKAKYDGSVGTLNWALAMEKAAEKGDEFEFRNSALGKLVNDAIMLSKLGNSEFKESLLEDLKRNANLEMGTVEANEAIQTMRESVESALSAENMTDEEILERVKKNASKVLTTLEEIEKAGDKIEKHFGKIDDDTKQALIYGELQIKDWKERENKIKETLKNNVNVENSIENSTASQQQQEFVARHGSIQQALKTREQSQKQIDALSELIKEKEKKQKELTKEEKDELKIAKEFLKAQKKEHNRKYKGLENLEEDQAEGQAEVILSEQDIMNLPSSVRAIMLDPKNIGHYTQKQQEIINNLIEKGTAQELNFENLIKDAGKIEQGITKYTTDYINAAKDNTGFNVYKRVIQNKIRKDGYNKKFDKLINEESYEKFAKELDNLLLNGTLEERRYLLQKFGEAKKNGTVNDNFIRYEKQRDQISKIINSALKDSDFRDLDANNRDLFAHALSFLSEKGIELTDENAVVEALSKTHTVEDGTTKNDFEQYVEEFNADEEGPNKLEFTSIGEVIQTYKSLIKKFNFNESENERINAPVIIEDGAKNDNRPPEVAAPEVTEKKEKSSTETEEQEKTEEEQQINNEIKEEGKVISNETENEIENKLQQAERKSIIEKYRASSEEVQKYAKIAENLSETITDENVKDEIKRILEKLGNDVYKSFNEFIQALQKEQSVQQELNNDSVVDQLNSLILNLTFRKQQEESKKKIEQQKLAEKESLKIKNILSSSKILSSAVNGLYTDKVIDIRNANAMSVVDFSYLKENYSSNPKSKDKPYSPLLAYLEKYHTEQFLQDDNLKSNEPVYFIHDPELQKEQFELYKSKNFEYGENNLPIVAVVERENGPLIIKRNGKDVRVQPIAVMPKTGAANTRGSNRLKSLRSLINPQSTEASFLETTESKDGDTRVHTKLNGIVHGKKIERDGNSHSIINLSVDGMTEEDKINYYNIRNKAQRRNTNLYTRIKNKFFRGDKYGPHIEFREFVPRDYQDKGDAYKRRGLFYLMPSLDGGFKDFYISVAELDEVEARDSHSKIDQIFANEDVNAALHFNSRIEGFINEINKYVAGFDMSKIIIDPLTGGITEESYEYLLEKSNELLNGKNYNRYVLLKNHKLNFKIDIVDNRPLLKIDLVNASDNTFVKTLATINKSTPNEGMTRDVAYNFLKSVILDENGKINKVGSTPMLKFQVDYENMALATGVRHIQKIDGSSSKLETDAKQIEIAKKDADKIYDDGILLVPTATLQREVTTFALDDPFDKNGNQRDFSAIYSNPENASPPSSVGERVEAKNQKRTKKGNVVDTDTGNLINTEEEIPETKTEGQIKAEKIADKMQKDAGNYSLTEDEENYQEKNSGRVYARVTKVIEADKENTDEDGKPKRFNKDGKNVFPSTNIGTGLDELQRDMFNGSITRDASGRWRKNGTLVSEIYPNVTQQAADKYLDSLATFIRKYKSRGYTFISREVMAVGSITTTDSEGNQHIIDVGGTCDLIAYDKHGNFHLFDFKSKHNGVITEEDKAKWGRQLSLYKQFLENKYGIKVESVSIIPTSVQYPDEHKKKAVYTKSEAKTHEQYEGRENNQLLLNGIPYKNTRPNLMETISYTQLKGVDVLFDNLTDFEKRAESSYIEKSKKEVAQKQEEEEKKEKSQNENELKTELPTGITEEEIEELIEEQTMFGEEITREEAIEMLKEIKKPNYQFVPSNLAWGKFQDFTDDSNGTLDSFETMKILEKLGYTEEKWNALSNEEKECTLRCKGKFK